MTDFLTCEYAVANILSLSGNQTAETRGGMDRTMTPAQPFRNCPTWQQIKKPDSESFTRVLEN